MLRKRPLRRLALVLLLVAVLLLGIMTAAATTADRFYASRIVAWREADFRDFEKFPTRRVPAGPNGFSFEPAPENPPEYLRKVTYRRDAPDPVSPRDSMATALDSTGGEEVTEPLDEFLAGTGTISSGPRGAGEVAGGSPPALFEGSSRPEQDLRRSDLKARTAPLGTLRSRVVPAPRLQRGSRRHQRHLNSQAKTALLDQTKIQLARSPQSTARTAQG